MRLIGIAGWSGSGKTTLIAKLIPALIRLGSSVSTVKRAHHAFDIDQPGKDSWVHRQAGATEVLVASVNRFALIHEQCSPVEPDLATLVGRLETVDIVLVEGFKHGEHPKIEIHRPALGKELLHPGDASFLAIASPAALPGVSLPWLPLDEPDRVARFILDAPLAEIRP
jgi:molybdopterin-guanine dinucleotide biosynthesis protein MobB